MMIRSSFELLLLLFLFLNKHMPAERLSPKWCLFLIPGAFSLKSDLFRRYKCSHQSVGGRNWL
ncbi:hypothetical protein I7I48_11031 [Histoplasma ohiense]|nr:hypothetical protein I7I48_11031 [Histoplasma ohiense (nom. inval.)]